MRSNLFFSAPRETSGNQFFDGVLHARGTKCKRIQAARRHFNERLTTATLTTPIPLERLLITRQRVFVFFSAPVLLRVVFPSVFRQRGRRRQCRFRALPSSLSCPPSWIVHCFTVFIFYFCPLIDIVMARYNFVTFDVLYCLQMVELKRKIADRLDSLYTVKICNMYTNLIILILTKYYAWAEHNELCINTFIRESLLQQDDRELKIKYFFV